METNYALKRKKTLWLLWLLFFAIAVGFTPQLTNAQPINGEISPNGTALLCPNESVTIYGINLDPGSQYRLRRDGNPVGTVKTATASGVINFGGWGIYGFYQIYNLTANQYINLDLTLSAAPYVNDSVVPVTHSQTGDTTSYHYICQYYTVQRYTIDPANLLIHGIDPADVQSYTWVVEGRTTSCDSVNVVTQPVSGIPEDIDVYWFSTNVAYIFCEILTNEGCTFTTKPKFVYVTPPHNAQFDFVRGTFPPWVGDTIHFCEDPGTFELTLEDSKTTGFPTCSNMQLTVPGGPAGYKYVLFEGAQGGGSTPIDTLDGTGGPLTFTGITMDPAVDTASYYVIAYSNSFTCSYAMGDIVVAVRDWKPDVDLGPDFTADCDATCADLLFTTGVPAEYRAYGYGYTWEHYSGPYTYGTTFTDIADGEVEICVADCNYGVHEFVIHIFNGECYNSDTIEITFIEQPTAEIAQDLETRFCDAECWTLEAAYTYDYCDGPGVDNGKYYWKVVHAPPQAASYLGMIIPDEHSVWFCPQSPCNYGVWKFAWFEVNVFGEDSCWASDTVTIHNFEPPTVEIAEDLIEFCEDDADCFTFMLYATPHQYCQVEDVYSCYEWTYYSADGWTATFTDPYAAETEVCIVLSKDACHGYGEWMFYFTEKNGDCCMPVDNGYACCEDTDSVAVVIYEQPHADAGDDFFACIAEISSTYYYLPEGNFEYCYTMYGEWTKACTPGDVYLDDPFSPTPEMGVTQFGRYYLVWNLWSKEGFCEDSDTVIIDFIQQPNAELLVAEDTSMCEDALCFDMTYLGVQKFQYEGTIDGGYWGQAEECPNFWDNGRWTVDMTPDGGPVPAADVMDDEYDHQTMMCVGTYGVYSVTWWEINGPNEECYSTTSAVVHFYEAPTATILSEDQEICGICVTVQAEAYEYAPAPNQTADNQDAWWEVVDGYDCYIEFADDHSPVTEICITNCEDCYTTYTLMWIEVNGNCADTAYVDVTFRKVPDPVPLTFSSYENACFDKFMQIGSAAAPNGYYMPECIWPEETVDVCAFGSTNLKIATMCNYDYDYCGYGFYDDCGTWIDYYNPEWTYQWSLIGPNGTQISNVFFGDECRGPWIDINWGECCEDAILYLTITTPYCEITYPYYFNVQHGPDATIAGDEVAEVSSIFTYSVPADDCNLYVWDVEFCGEIVSGWGTNEILVHWMSYEENGGMGKIWVYVLDTCTGCCSTGELDVTVFPMGTLGDGVLDGFVNYHNEAFVAPDGTPLNGVEFTLWNGDVAVMQTMSFNDIGFGDDPGNGPGYFAFEGLNETTVFTLTAAYDAPWYGCNATDALATMLYALPAPPNAPDALVELAADVNANGNFNATDALWMLQRPIGLVDYFPAGDWAFEDMATAVGTVNVKGLNYGDVFISNIPGATKDMPAISLVKDGVMYVETGEQFELPIRVASAMNLGAVTLNINFDSELLEIVDVSSFPGMVSNISETGVSVAWASTSGVELFDNDAVITLTAIAKEEINSDNDLFTIELGTEFADKKAVVYDELTLKAFGISTDIAPAAYSLGYNRPNPFNSTTEIEYTLPESGKVVLSVVDVFGKEIATLVNATQSAGSYTIKFSAAGLEAGVYLYKIIVDGENQDYVETRRMIISQ